MIAIGIDGGGTHTRAISSDGSEVLGAASNVTTMGVERAAETLSELIGRMGLGLHVPLSIVAGIAGAADPSLQKGLQNALARRFESQVIHLEVLTDAELALDAAHGIDRPGMAAIAGTGSIALIRTPAGSIDRCGGWGPSLGDLGGGYRIGLAGLTAVADAFDGGPPTMLCDVASEKLGIGNPQTLRAYLYEKRSSPAAFAPSVLDACERSDGVALHILRQQVNDLANRVDWLHCRHPSRNHALHLFGGLANRKVYRSEFLTSLQLHQADWTVLRPSSSPVEAALKRALTLEGAT